MLSVYALTPTGLQRIERGSDEPIPEEALWLDLLEPTPEEEKLVETRVGVNVPTREEMREIESSSRLYEEDGALYLTATVVTKLDSDLPENAQITFILKGPRLVTNRYIDPLPFRRYVGFAERHPGACSNGSAILTGLLESVINRIADVIERVGSDLDVSSAEVFNRPGRRRRGAVQRDFRKVLERVGQSGELIAKVRESLVSLARLLAFVQQSTATTLTPDARQRLRTVSKDVVSLSDHANFLGNNLSFVLDATLGMINIDQNNILKIFSVVTTFLLPPSVIAGIYGMNFEHIPWAHESWGFLAALLMMLGSAVAPYVYFKRRGWL